MPPSRAASTVSSAMPTPSSTPSDMFREHYPQAIRFHGEHRLNDKIVFHYLMPVIRWIDDRQSDRSRPVVFIHSDCLADDYGKPLSSLHKAYEFLLENYAVYFVAPAPTNDHALLAPRPGVD